MVMENNFNVIFIANGRDMQRLINTHVEASKIGRQIAEQVIDSQRRAGDSSSGSSPDPDTNPIIPISTAETLISTSNSPDQRSMHTPSKLNGTVNNNFSHVRNNVILPNDPGKLKNKYIFFCSMYNKI